MLREGASMTMEAWGQEYKPNQDWCHAWGTVPANYIVRHLAGIQPLTPGFGEVEIKPQPGSLEHAALTYQTIRGAIEESFDNKPDSFTMRIILPGNTIGHVYLPCRSGSAVVRMDGHVVKVSCHEGYCEIRHVNPGEHYLSLTHLNPTFSRPLSSILFIRQEKTILYSPGELASFRASDMPSGGHDH